MTPKEKALKTDDQSGLYDEPRVKLYTEEQVRELLNKILVLSSSVEDSINSLIPIEPPSDEEIIKEQERQMLIGLLDWINKVTQDNPMALETDYEDIVEMYLRGYYTK